MSDNTGGLTTFTFLMSEIKRLDSLKTERRQAELVKFQTPSPYTSYQSTRVVDTGFLNSAPHHSPMYGQFAVQDQARAQQSAQPYGRPEYDAHASLQKHHLYQVSSQHAYPYQQPSAHAYPVQQSSKHAYPVQQPSHHAYPVQQPSQHAYPFQHPQHAYPVQQPSQHAYPFQHPQHAYPFQHPQHAYPFQQPYQHPYSYQQPMPANHADMQQDGSPQSATNESTINEGAMNAELQYVSNAPVHSEKPRALFPLTLATGRLR
jgi:hypothetical protein